jgi:pyruvate kinase
MFATDSSTTVGTMRRAKIVATLGPTSSTEASMSRG